MIHRLITVALFLWCLTVTALEVIEKTDQRFALVIDGDYITDPDNPNQLWLFEDRIQAGMAIQRLANTNPGITTVTIEQLGPTWDVYLDSSDTGA